MKSPSNWTAATCAGGVKGFSMYGIVREFFGDIGGEVDNGKYGEAMMDLCMGSVMAVFITLLLPLWILPYVTVRAIGFSRNRQREADLKTFVSPPPTYTMPARPSFIWLAFRGMGLSLIYSATAIAVVRLSDRYWPAFWHWLHR